MDKSNGQKSAAEYLYPPIEPFDQGMFAVGDDHRIYVEQCGNPNGVPVVVLHGGPGGGCSPMMRRFFDPKHYRIVLFDQRGCGKSRPHASVENNTTWDLVRDIEHIREKLGIEQWAVFGGSWGATLSLIYAITHPDRATHLILRGVFLMTEAELKWFYGGGAGQFWPDLWADLVNLLPEDERDDVIGAYHRRLFSGDYLKEVKFARAWAGWENALASIRSVGGGGSAPADYARAFARLENHYFVNQGFLPKDGYIIDNTHKINDIQTFIVQGRYDMICPPHSAYALAAKLDKSDLRLIPLAGHAMSEVGITAELVAITNRLRSV